MKGRIVINKHIGFGPSGNSDSFYDQGFKSSMDMPQWLHNMGLDAYEYSCTRGVMIKEKTAGQIGEQAAKYGIRMSIHAPYYINLASQDPAQQQKSVGYLLSSLEAASWFGADRVVFHPGACSRLSRETAMETALMLLAQALDAGSSFIQKGIHLCPETMGKKNQLGNLEEVITLCRLDDSLLPTIDFGHLHALGQGALTERRDFEEVLQAIIDGLGYDRASNFHAHFSRIEYTAAGEKKHWCYEDKEYGPDFDPLAELLIERKLHPRIICESRGKMAEDALVLKGIYEEKLSLFNGKDLW